MYQRLLLKNIHLLNYSILKGLLENQNIYLNDEEAIVVTNILKKNIEDLMNGYYEESFSELNGKLSSEKYKLLRSLYFEKIKKIS